MYDGSFIMREIVYITFLAEFNYIVIENSKVN